MKQVIPRIRGRVGQTDDPEFKDKWFFEIVIATLYGENIGEPIGPFGPYETEAIAKEELRKAARKCCDSFAESVGQKPTTEYLDLKNGAVLRSWDEQ